VLVVDGVTDVHVDWQLIAAASGVMSVLVLARFVDLLSVVQTQAVQLAALARTDALTGVPNRRSWDYELGRAYELAREHDDHLAVAVLDLDHFKAFNDGHGHQAGDLLLKEAATAWRAALPADALLARYGGEEFAVLLPGHRLDEAAAAIARLRGCTPGGQTFSAGVCEWRYAGQPANPVLLVTHADRALYRAKQSGRDRVAVAPPPGPDPVPVPRAAPGEAEQRP
jgi:diguanylate cyclase (GGDEF)-like protein